MTKTVLVAGARTPIGKIGGALASFSAVELGAHAIRGALKKTGIKASDVDAVIMGNVLQAGVGPNPARQAAISASIPFTTPAVTINNLCLSGLQAVIDADRLIRMGDAEIVVAGGMESMTNSPYLARGARTGYRYGTVALEDALERDALVCAFDKIPMGEATDLYLRRTSVSREIQDAFAARSHQLADAATKNGIFEAEIAPVDVVSRRGTTTIDTDEGIRPGITASTLGSLPPAFLEDGSITAGSSSQLSDGAAAVVLMSSTKAADLGLTWLAELGSSAFVAGPDTSLLHQPANALLQALDKDHAVELQDINVLEVNEAFAGVATTTIEMLGVDAGIVNIHGGAIALGHPVGMSGARLALSAAHSLNRRGGGIGAVALCGGGGQGNALILKHVVSGKK